MKIGTRSILFGVHQGAVLISQLEEIKKKIALASLHLGSAISSSPPGPAARSSCWPKADIDRLGRELARLQASDDKLPS